MREVLILCVDRDNDVGEKAGVETPAIGWDAVFNAAVSLALADPEDSDLNAIFEALRIYRNFQQKQQHISSENREHREHREHTEQDKQNEEHTEQHTEHREHRKNGENGKNAVEVALIAGDKDVGIRSDTKIASQIDQVIRITGARRAIIVTDGSEDEEILPIIQSRLLIEAVRRVIVRQSEPLESGFYMIKRLIEEEKFVRSFLPLIGLVMLAFSISLFVGHPEFIFGVIIGVIGVYALLKGFGLEGVARDFLHSLKISLFTGKLTLISYICAVILVIAGTFQGIQSALAYSEKDLGEFTYILILTEFVRSAVWWYVCAAIVPVAGKMVNMVIEGERIVRQWTVLFSVIASGLLIFGGSECILAISGGNPWSGYQTLFFSILGAIILSFIGARISGYAKTLYAESAKGVENYEEIIAEEMKAEHTDEHTSKKDAF